MKASRLSIVRLTGRIVSPLVCIVIGIFSLLPPNGVPGSSWLFLFGDKTAHGASYAALGCCLFLATAVESRKVTLLHVLRTHFGRMLLLLGVIVLLGTIIEIVQPLFGRSFEAMDIRVCVALVKIDEIE